MEGIEAGSSGNEAGALAAFAKATTLSPKFATAHYNVGVIEAKTDAAKAERSYREVLAAALPAQRLLRADAQNNLAFLLLRQKQNLDEAEQLAKSALEVRPERASYLDTLGEVCDTEGKAGCALGAYRALLATTQEIPAEVRAHAEERVKALSAH